MGHLRTYLLMLAIGAAALPASAERDLSQTFAGCAARYSAEMEFAWLTSDPAAERYEAYRATFISLVEATTPEDQLRDMLHHRISVKQAHSALLTRATFGTDATAAEHAQKLALRFTQQCAGLLLES